jgi:hypothetical protein
MVPGWYRQEAHLPEGGARTWGLVAGDQDQVGPAKVERHCKYLHSCLVVMSVMPTQLSRRDISDIYTVV